MSIKYIHLIRHGEPEAGYTKKFLGRLDPALSPVGVHQAELMAKRIRPLRPDVIISSPSRRARETAEVIADMCDLPLQTDPGLLEIDFGELEGMTFKEAAETFPGITDNWQALAGDFSFPGGENFLAFNQRCLDAANEIKQRPEKRIVMVAHGGVLRGVLCNLLAVEADGPLRFRLAYAALTTLEQDESGMAILTEFNVGRSDIARQPA